MTTDSVARERLADRRFIVTLTALALLARVVLALNLAHEPVWDGHYYHYGAERIAEGHGYSEVVFRSGEAVNKPWSHYPVGYSAFLALLYFLFGSGLEVAPVGNAVISATSVFVAFYLARTFLSSGRSKLAAVLVAFHPGLIAYNAALMTEGLIAFLLLLAGLFAVRYRGRLLAPMGFGISLGLAALVRPTALLALPLFLLVNRDLGLGAIKHLGVAAAMAGLVVAPWSLRNCRVMDGCALISTNGGWNLAIGALTETGRFHPLKATDGCRVVTGQVQQDRCWTKIGVEIISADPIRWLRRMPQKLEQTFNHESFIVEYLHEADPVTWTEERRVRWRSWLTSAHRLLLFLASFGVSSSLAFSFSRTLDGRMRAPWVQQGLALGIASYAGWALFQSPPPLWPLALLPVAVALLCLPGRPPGSPTLHYLLGLLLITAFAHAVFFGDDRYHLVVTPSLCILAAAAFRAPIMSPREPATASGEAA